MKTKELDIIAEGELKRLGAESSFKGYRGYPATLCVSINDEIVHGIPGDRVLKEGDIVSLDFGAIYHGFHGDAAVTVPVGEVSPDAKRLIETTRACLEKGIAAACAGTKLGDVSAAIQSYAESKGYSLVREYTGHGIGRKMHEDPQIPNYGDRIDAYYSVKPGITGLWQVSGRNNTSFEERAGFDEYYIHNWSVWLDVYILLRTVWVVLLRDGAY